LAAGLIWEAVAIDKTFERKSITKTGAFVEAVHPMIL
jgi:hypothetical protein